MKLSIITTITNPDERQDRWKEAINCYCKLADEVIIVNGGIPISVGFIFKHPKVKMLDLDWPYEWNWIEYPHHLNRGKELCTGDFILRLDIDQFIHEKDFENLRDRINKLPNNALVATMQKISMAYGKKYYQKGSSPNIIRNVDFLKYGEQIDKKTDLCFPVDTRGIKDFKTVDGKILYRGTGLLEYKTGIQYWNYDYFFKTKEFTKKEFWRASRAYQRFFGEWEFGESEEKSFDYFIKMLKGRYNKSPYSYELKDHPKWIRKEVENLTKDQAGYDLWGLGGI